MSIETKWNAIKGDGYKQPCSEEQLAKIKEGFSEMCNDAGNSVNDRRALADATRFTVWPGQSYDGKKHRAALGGVDAFPFEGASDKRERTADNITNEQVMVLMAAIMRMNLGFDGVPGANQQANDVMADKISALWEWVKKNQLGVEWFTEWTKFCQWRQGDSPAVGIMQVYWHQERELRLEHVTVEEFQARVWSKAAEIGVELGEADTIDFSDMVLNEERHEELASLLRSTIGDISAASASRAATALRQEGEASFPVPRIAENRLRIKARRLFHHIFIPENTTELQRARRIDVREWFSEEELREMDSAGDFKPGFVEEVLKHEGESAWKQYMHCDLDGTYSEAALERSWDKSRQKGLYEIITTFYRASNADGIPGTYQVKWNAGVNFAGTDAELLGYDLKKRRYPFVESCREILSDSIWASRGNSELSSTEQQALKMLHDMFTDYTQLTTVPPLEVPANRPKLGLVIAPLTQVRVNRPGEIKFMNLGGQFPQAADRMMAIVREGIDRYFGRISESNPRDLVRLYQQSLVDSIMLPVVEVMTIGIHLCQQFMDAETVAQIVGPNGIPIGKDVEDIRGGFQVTASFEAGMLSLEYMKEVGSIISTFVLPWDTKAIVPRDALVKWFFSSLSSSFASRLVRPVEEAEKGEIEDEERNFVKIAAGIEPPMMEDGQNWELRRQTLLRIGQKNPEAFQKLGATGIKILEARLKHFDGMIEQQKNAVIGRTMAAPALGEPNLG